MTVAQLIRRFNQTVAYDLDPIMGLYPDSGTTQEQDDWTQDCLDFLNEASLELATMAYLTKDSATLTLTANVGTYPLSSSAWSARMIQPFSIVVDGRRLTDAAGTTYGIWTVSELIGRYPTWATDASGSVARAVFLGDRLILHPAPSAGGTATVFGKTGPALFTLADQTAVPDVPERLHPYIATLAVYKACMATGQQGAQFNRLATMQTEAFGMALEIQRESLNAMVGNGSTAYNQRQEYLGV